MDLAFEGFKHRHCGADAMPHSPSNPPPSPMSQALIAMVNTALTALGMWVLQIPGIGLLSLFVFLCSFIPIAGCIISTVPIGFVALTEVSYRQAQ